MENASNALLMAGGVLIGVLILSMMAYVFVMFYNYSSESYAQMGEAEISQFNAQFLKYYGQRPKEDGTEETILCTAHDIITIANLAKEYNKSNETENLPDGEINQNIYYVRISIPSSSDVPNELRSERTKVEKWNSEQQLLFIKNSMKEITEAGKTRKEIRKYKCTACDISTSTKRVYYMEFIEV